MSRNKKHSEKRSLTLRTLYYWGKFIGINPLILLNDNKVESSYLGLFYTCLLVVNYSYVHHWAFIERMNFVVAGEKQISIIVDFMGMNNVFYEILSTWLIFGFYQNRVKLIVESFTKAEKTSEKLEIWENYDKRFEKLGIYLILTNIFYIGTIVTEYVTLSNFPNYHALIWICWCLPRISSLNTMTIFVWCLINVKRKFHRLNEKVKFLMQHNYGKFHESDDKVDAGLIRNTRYNPATPSDAIDLISQLHRELRDVIDRIKEHFDFLVLLCMITQLLTLTLNAYRVYSYSRNNFPMNGVDLLYVNFTIYLVLFPIALLTVISNACGSTIDEANETGNILHGMLNNHQNFGVPQEVAKFYTLSFDLLQNPVKLTLFGFFDLDYFLVYKVITASTTYLVIMLQFNT